MLGTNNPKAFKIKKWWQNIFCTEVIHVTYNINIKVTEAHVGTSLSGSVSLFARVIVSQGYCNDTYSGLSLFRNRDKLFSWFSKWIPLTSNTVSLVMRKPWTNSVIWTEILPEMLFLLHVKLNDDRLERLSLTWNSFTLKWPFCKIFKGTEITKTCLVALKWAIFIVKAAPTWILLKGRHKLKWINALLMKSDLNTAKLKTEKRHVPNKTRSANLFSHQRYSSFDTSEFN